MALIILKVFKLFQFISLYEMKKNCLISFYIEDAEDRVCNPATHYFIWSLKSWNRENDLLKHC